MIRWMDEEADWGEICDYMIDERVKEKEQKLAQIID